nr:pirin-like C-terminal cupin domain-containing protein [Sphingobium baderi]
MLIGGEPIGERFLYWTFVSSSQNRLAQAAADWKAGRMKLPDCRSWGVHSPPGRPPTFCSATVSGTSAPGI